MWTTLIALLQLLCSMKIISVPLLLIGAGLWLLHLWQQKFKMAHKLPGPTPVPLFGNALLAIGRKPEEIVDLFFDYGQKIGDVVRLFLGHRIVVFLGDAKDAEVILNSDVHIDKARDYRFFNPC